ncbi:TetR/AcrR family transcriptional regulator [Paenibacillus odorifer]|uniref:TetR family transcriptional regulator n=1 Tax=Paenibacillus odorifer TaxID=189426 RepID=A0A1R0ZBE3_9BACL|nr:TetR/AcrR family transcriptional regulator [Paenibacillus odorifer]MBY3622878.1 TetR/AcrR family transcriptional regulator [Acinetobacter sp. CUI P1]AIQ72453.1 TetR family transcriptional regulator [Paenibacillus odorifer]OME20355.1 TetR family transcriptional regulator [Paenibacillus odorifer]OME30488.1 TetR family transcriptional regulator [Paenibacillus odorifer]OME30874.1 TetR family transcriptional regulator [Paenibacillus odorifer]
MTKNKLKEVAMRLFGEKGYEGTALSEIAKEVGVKTPAIYAFFENKEDLFMTVFREAMQSYNTYIQELSEEQKVLSAQESLRGILSRQYEFYQKSPEASKIVLRYVVFPPAFLKETIEEAFLESDAMLTKIIEQFISKGMEEGVIRDQSVQLLADAFLNLMDGLSMQYFYYTSKGIYERKLNHAFEMYWKGASS